MVSFDIEDDFSASCLLQSYFIFYRVPAHLRANHSNGRDVTQWVGAVQVSSLQLY